MFQALGLKITLLAIESTIKNSAFKTGKQIMERQSTAHNISSSLVFMVPKCSRGTCQAHRGDTMSWFSFFDIHF